MRHKKLRKQDIEFLSKFDKCLKDNTWQEIRSVTKYVEVNNLSIKKVCEFLNWQVGDKKEIFEGRETKLLMIRQKKGNFLTFKFIEPTYELSKIREKLEPIYGLTPDDYKEELGQFTKEEDKNKKVPFNWEY